MNVRKTDMTSVVPSPGEGRIFHDGMVHQATWRSEKWLSAHEVLITLDDGRELAVSDAEDRLGFIYHAPDSGDRMESILVLLDPDEPDPTGIPTRAELAGTLLNGLEPVLKAISAGTTDPDDLDYCRQLFKSQAAMLRSIQKNGSIDAAQKDILKKLFGIDACYWREPSQEKLCRDAERIGTNASIHRQLMDQLCVVDVPLS